MFQSCMQRAPKLHAQEGALEVLRISSGRAAASPVKLMMEASPTPMAMRHNSMVQKLMANPAADACKRPDQQPPALQAQGHHFSPANGCKQTVLKVCGMLCGRRPGLTNELEGIQRTCTSSEKTMEATSSPTMKAAGRTPFWKPVSLNWVCRQDWLRSRCRDNNF